MKASELEREQVLDYFAAQMADDPVVHLEKVAVERVGSVLHDIWDVHCKGSRWWAISNSLNYYSQEDFKSRDVALTFQVGLMVRIASREEVPITEEAAGLLPRSWRQWEQAVDSLDGGREAEDFQAVGVRLREAMVTYAGEVADDALVPEGDVAPKAADVVGWTNLLIAHLAEGPSSKQLRSYATKLTRDVGLRQLAHPCKERDCLRRAHRCRCGESLPVNGLRGMPARCKRCEEQVRGLRLLPDRERFLHALRVARHELRTAGFSAADPGGACRTTGEALRAQLGHLHVHVPGQLPR